MDSRGQQATVHGVAKSQTWLSDWSHTYILRERRKSFKRIQLYIYCGSHTKMLFSSLFERMLYIRYHHIYSKSPIVQLFELWTSKDANTYSIHVSVCLISCIQLVVTSWTVSCQALLSKEFSRQKHWRGLPFSPLGDVSNLGIEHASPALAGRFFTTEPPGKPSVRHEWSHSLLSISYFWRPFSSTNSQPLLSPPVSNASCLFTQHQSLEASCHTVLLNLSRYCAVRLKMFSLFFCVYQYYLC